MKRLFIGVLAMFVGARGLAACASDPGAGADGGTGPRFFTATPPLKQPLVLNGPVRALVLRQEERSGSDRRGTTCGLTALLFTTSANPQVTATTVDPAGCRLYVQDPDEDLHRQRWICAGGFNVASGALMTNVGFCPQPGATRVAFDVPLQSCGGFASARTATLSSMMEIDGDVLTDLNATVRFPAPVQMTEPNNLGIGSWPATGPLTVKWTSADATSAMVTIEPEAPTAMSPRIVCPAVLNGELSVPASMIDQVGLRNVDARLKVWSFRDGTTMAEGNNTYRVAGAMVTNFTLQGRR